MKINHFDYFNQTKEATDNKFANKANSEDFDIDIKFAAKGSDLNGRLSLFNCVLSITCLWRCQLSAACPTRGCA